MKNSTKQVIILDKFSSPDIQQAIIILKNNTCENETKIILEAENVINKYLNTYYNHSLKPDKKGSRILAATLAVGTIITSLAICGAVCLIKNTL